jgi:hypothetical protein
MIDSGGSFSIDGIDGIDGTVFFFVFTVEIASPRTVEIALRQSAFLCTLLLVAGKGGGGGGFDGSVPASLLQGSQDQLLSPSSAQAPSWVLLCLLMMGSLD